MPVNIPRLRYWFAAAAALIIAVVAVFYFYARMQADRVVTQVPNKLPAGVERSTVGFSYSKSEGGHTLFTVRARQTTQYQQGDRAQLKDVNIVIYGRQSNRFDQIYGDDFSYDPQSGDVIANGAVHIDLQGDSTGLPHADQAPPKELKNPLHINTSALVFNQKTGDAHTSERVDFHIPQATGWAIGARYDSKRNELFLDRDIHVTVDGPDPVSMTARQGSITKDPRRAVLHDAHMVRQDSTVDAAELTLFLRSDDSIERITGSGGVDSTSTGPTTLHVRAPDAVLYLQGRSNELQRASLTGGTIFDASGLNTMFGSSDSVFMQFDAKSQLSKLHAQGNVKMIQLPKAGVAPVPPPKPGEPGPSTSHSQTMELNADAIDFWLANGNELQRAETSPNARITLAPLPSAIAEPRNATTANPASVNATATAQSGQRTVITAAKLYAGFKENRIQSMIGKPDAQVVSYTPGQPDKVSTSQQIEAEFAPEGGISQVTQRGDFHYTEHLPRGGDRAAWADSAVYSSATETLVLNGRPRVVEGGMTTTARVVRMDRKNGDASAEDSVKTTYSELKPQPGGALLASGEPIHVTAHAMTAQRGTGMAHYSGDARLWQGANVVAASTIDFDRNSRNVLATGDKNRRVATVLTQKDKSGKPSPINVTSATLTYSDNQRLAQFDGNVLVRSADGTLNANHVDAYLKPAAGGAQPHSSASPSQASQVDTIVAGGNVVLQQPTRRGTGQRLVYTADKDEYVLTGGPPSIFDAEQGTITGASLTFYNRDDRVLVEGGDTSRAVTHTRVPK
jgi:lipopolysaccharide export system protein LptA